MQNKKVQVYGFTRSYSKFGSALSALVAAGLVFFKGDYGIIFLASTIPYFFDLLLMFSYPEDVITPHPRGFLYALKNHLKKTFLAFKSLKGLTISVVNLSLNSSLFKVSKDYLQPILNTWALSLPIFLGYIGEKRTALIIGVVYFFIYITASSASRNAGRIKDKMGPSTQAINIIYLITLFSFFLVGIFNLFDFIYPIIFIFLIMYFLRNARKPMMVGYIADITDSSHMATVLSMENQLRSLIALFVAPILGFLADSIGISMVFVFCGVILLIGYSILKINPSIEDNT